MKMTKRLLSTLILSTATLTALPLTASAFGLSSITSAIPGVGGGSTNAVSAGDIDTFIQTAKQADQLINQSTELMASSVESADQIAKQKAARDAANGIADPKEQKAAVEQLQTDAQTQLQKALSSDDINNKIASMSAEQRKSFGAAAINFTIGLLKDKQLVSSSSSLVAGVTANPRLVTRLPDLKDVVSSVSSQASHSASIGMSLAKLVTSGKIKALPTSADSKPVETGSMTE
jgi:hypothetical protein